MKSRLVLIFMTFTALWIVMAVKAGSLQVLPDDRLTQLKKRQFNKIVTLQPRRGAIVDRNNKELAVSMKSYSLYADPKIINNIRYTTQKLAKHFGAPRKFYYNKLKNRKKRFVWLHRQLSQKDYKKISRWNIRGLSFIEEPKRIYPNDQLFAHGLGFVGRDGKGLEGLEHAMDDILSGVEKRMNLGRDARGRPLIANGQIFTELPHGPTLQLSLDVQLQYQLEKELNQAIEVHDADSAVGVVLDARTSEVLAMANAPAFNANRATRYNASHRRNRVIADAYEPGSTMKTFVVAAALENELVKPNTKINCENGSFKIGRRIIREADVHHKFDVLTVSEVLAMSSNIGSAKLALKLGDKKLSEFLQRMGFGKKSGLSLSGEAKGIFHDPPWNKHLLSTISFGHGMTATPLQIAAAYAAIANGGVLRKPVLVKSIFDEVGNDKINFEKSEGERVLRKETADMLKLMLMSATSKKATGYNARVPGYPVAGKTGTAQKVDLVRGGYLDGAYISSFAGFAPANDPRFVIYIALDNPRNKYYGSQVAAPIFSKLASYALRNSGIDPILISKENLFEKKKELKVSPVVANLKQQSDMLKESKTPNLIGLSLREVLQVVRGSSVDLSVKGTGRVATMLPKPGEQLPDNKKIRVVLESEAKR